MGNIRRLGARAGVMLAAIAVAVTAAVAVSPNPDRTVQAIGDPLGAGGEFHSVTPKRILDTRDPQLDVAPNGAKSTNTVAASTTFDVPVVGKAGLPAYVDDDADDFDDNVLAVVVNITVITPSRLGYLRAFPAGADRGHHFGRQLPRQHECPEHRRDPARRRR